MTTHSFRDKVVLITGANNPRGIGASAARAFAARGARVFLTYLRIKPEDHGIETSTALQAKEPGLPFYYGLQTQEIDPIIAEIEALGGKVAAEETDLSIASNIPPLFDHVETTFGPVNVLVNNAAHAEWPETIFNTNATTIDRHFDVNTRAAVLLIAEFVQRYKAHHNTYGRVINLSTDSAQRFTGSISYGASKAALEAFTRSIAIEVGELGITVNTIAPGPIQTGYISAKTERELVKEIPLGRIGQPEDIANAILFLASEQAAWLTGQVILISGGHAI